MFYSQAGQDLWVLQKIGNKGFFVDVGGHDGIESSNTYALSQAGWGGVCIEPNKEAFKKLQDNRGCILINTAAVETGECSLAKILYTVAAPLIIDYLSIDVDGGEMGVLKGMDFERYHVKLITIEHNQYLEGTERQGQIFSYLTAHGFSRTHKDVKCLDGEWFGKIYEDWYENTSNK